MVHPLSFNRRAFAKWLGALPLVGYVGARDLLGKAWSSARPNIYTRIGVKPLINARGVWTYLSGTLELPAVRAAKEQAAMHFVDMFELQRAVGKRIAEIAGAEAAMVTSGAAGAMAAATAACMAGTDPKNIWQLPDTTGMKNEVVMFGGRNVFDSAIRLAGARVLVAHTQEELAAAIGGKTAMIYTASAGEPLNQALAVSKRTQVPLLLDQAAGIPPFDSIRLYARMGCDLYAFSGGKGLFGPQCTGLLLGRKDLIDAAVANSSPWEGSVCRALKVGKEEMMGCLAAVEWWASADLPSLDREWRAKLARIVKLVETVPGVTAEVNQPAEPYQPPRLKVSWDERSWGFSIADCDQQLRQGEPRIEVLTWDHSPCVVPAARDRDVKRPAGPNEMFIIAQTLQPGDELIIGRRLREILSQARKTTRPS